MESNISGWAMLLASVSNLTMQKMEAPTFDLPIGVKNETTKWFWKRTHYESLTTPIL